MFDVRPVNDLKQCGQVWRECVAPRGLFDLWEVRACFHEHYQRETTFLVAHEGGQAVGLLPLSYIPEASGHAFFPGETWGGKTWLEQNRIHGRTEEIRQALLESCPAGAHLRYLVPDSVPAATSAEVDEIGFLFHPPQFGCDMANYWQAFSGKSRKRLGAELKTLTDLGETYRYDHFEDIDLLLQMNLVAFGEHSYFHDARFMGGFRALMNWLRESGMLRVTTLMLGGTVAAVDVGAVYRNTYTVMAGGTNGEFMGVAKLINLHHIAWACQQKLTEADFLCGDFGWKGRFHLTPRPLHQIHTPSGSTPQSSETPAEVTGDVG